MTTLSVLDLSPIVEGGDVAQALRNSLDLAQHVEPLGYTRYWVAEHHNLAGVASSATAVLIAYIAGGTTTLRVGAGGIMLPNHAPLVIAEQFGTLESLYPGRIDLGVGRAPGTDQMTMRALRRHLNTNADDEFISDVVELAEYFQPPRDEPRHVKAIPGFGLHVPMWILGSSLYGAQVAAHLGLPYAFASHFAPSMLIPALRIYREKFKPSGAAGALTQPYVMVGVNVIAAPTDDEAHYLFTSLQQRFLGMVRNRRGPLQPPVPTMDGIWSPHEQEAVAEMLRVSAVGSPASVRAQLDTIIAETRADELIASTGIFDHALRKRSYALLASAMESPIPAKLR